MAKTTVQHQNRFEAMVAQLPGGWELLAVGPGGDWYLHTVLCRKLGDQGMKYVTWTFNTSCGGFHNGHYFDGPSGDLRDGNDLLGKAWADYERRCLMYLSERNVRPLTETFGI